MTKSITLFIATLFLLISCREYNNNPIDENPQAESCKIATITYGYFSGNKVYTATYSGENLIELTSIASKVVYTYNSQNHLIKKDFFDIGDSQVKFRTEFTANSNGKIIEERNWLFESGNLQYTGKYTYRYNADKIAEIINYAIDDTTIQGKLVFEWTGENPTKLLVFDVNNILECENTFIYDLTRENKFNSIFEYYSFQDIFDADINLYFFLGENVIVNTISCSGDTDVYNSTLTSNGLLDNVNLNGDLRWRFEYNCE